jgi:rhodanese-related sulfurtransferase
MVLLIAFNGILMAAEPVKAGPMSAKICLNCHKPVDGRIMGHFDSVSMSAQSLQIEIDGKNEVVRFDGKNLKLLNPPSDGNLDKQLHAIKKGHQIRADYAETAGVKFISLLSVKPPLKVSPEQLMKIDEMEKLVALGPEKGKYTLIDSRPLPKFQEGAIPSAINIPYPSLKKMTDKLPKDKQSQIVLYCAGVTCALSPNSAKELSAMGYTNIRIYHDGMPDWAKRNYTVLTPQSYKEAWVDKENPAILLDIRPVSEIAKGFIKGAVALSPDKLDELLKAFPDKKLKAPIVVYDEAGGDKAAEFARKLISKGYNNTKLLTGGFHAWRAVNYPVATGQPESKVTYIPKPKPGTVTRDEFSKLAKALPADTVFVDVRDASEVREGGLKGSLNLPAEQLQQRLVELDRNKRIITYCNTGTRAEMGYSILKNAGYNANFYEGIIDFQKDGSFSFDD